MVKQYRGYIVLALLVLVLDQLTKLVVRLGDLFTTGAIVDITFIINTGSLFSLFDSVNAINIIFIIISLFALGFLIYYVEQEKKYLLGIGLLLGGILGNLFDRIFVGGVIDWINFHIWPVFNLADAAIVTGVIVTIIMVLRDDRGD
ncbi:signal peptidase II [Candidatus Woesearchaeota archaeon]|nr:signal peptidase II [Candidatus Woesearchaeota archaeon]